MSKKVLLADSSVSVHKVVELALIERDVQLQMLTDGNEALEKARRFEPDFVLADIELPGLDGYSLCERLKAEPALESAKVVLLKPSFANYDDARAAGAGADGMLSKPFSASALLRIIDLQMDTGDTGEPSSRPLFVEAAVEDEGSAPDEVFGPAPGAPEEPEEGEVVSDSASFSDLQDEEAAPEQEPELDLEPPAGQQGVSAAEIDQMAGAAEAGEEAIPTHEIDFERDLAGVEDFHSEVKKITGVEPAEGYGEPVTEADVAAEPEPEVQEIELSEPLGLDEDYAGPEISHESLAERVELLEKPGAEVIDLTQAPPEPPPFEPTAAAPPEPAVTEELVERVARLVMESAPAAPPPQPELSDDLIERLTTEVIQRLPEPASPDPAALVSDELIAKLTERIHGRIEASAAQLDQPGSSEEGRRLVGQIVSQLSDELVKEIAWEVVPDLAEKMIKEALDKVTKT